VVLHVQEVEVQLVLGDRAVEADRRIDETERDRARPERTRHARRVGVRVAGAVAAADRLPGLWAVALRARWKRLHRLDAELVAAVRALVCPGGHVTADWGWIR